MRLVRLEDDGTRSLTEFFEDMPQYAILSHTWGEDGAEVTMKDLLDGTSERKPGHEKIRFCEAQIVEHGLNYFWVDTCCIDKTSSAELSEAINSMFRWYQNSAKCYVYLSDVSKNDPIADLGGSRWFTRGWTLQELLAPKLVEFYSREGALLGDRESLLQILTERTGIPSTALQGGSLSKFGIEERKNWATGRRTKREEDQAYSLLGIFDVNMPLIYGEGRRKAMHRLEKEIEELSDDNHEPTGPDLANAIRDGRYDLVTSLLDRGVSVNHVVQSGNAESLLHLAIRCGSDRILDRILAAEPHLDFFSGQGITPLMLTAVLGDLRTASKLLDAGCALEPTLLRLRKSVTPMIDLDHKVTDGSTALLLAAQNGRHGIVQLLLDRGAKVNASESRGFTPLIAACMQGHPKCVKLLLQYGASTHNRATDDFTALIHCAKRGMIESANDLLDAGADINEHKMAGMTPLLEAAWLGRVEFAEFIIRRGANIAARATWVGDYGGFSALHIAVDDENKRMVETLLRCGVDPSIRNDAGETAPEYAKRIGHDYLLDAFKQPLTEEKAE